MNGLSDSMYQVHEILQEYVLIHDHIFKPSLRKKIPIPLFFKPIDFGKHFEALGLLASSLNAINVSVDTSEQQSLVDDYMSALLSAINSLSVLCKSLSVKAEGGTYSKDDYESDVADYLDLVDEYRAIGEKITLQLKDFGIPTGGLVNPPKSWTLINHLVHIIIGLLIPGAFVWTTKGILAAVLLSIISQFINQFRIYRHYLNEFQYLDRIQGGGGHLEVYKKDALLKHGQIFIIMVIWYGLVTMVVAGFRQ